MNSICANCSYSLDEGYKFCPNCSQKTSLHRLNMHDVVHEAIHYFTHADKGIFGLLKDLVVKNGRVAKEYVEGKRKRYFPPLNFYLLVATVFVIVINLASPKEQLAVNSSSPEIQSIKDPVQRNRVIQIYERRSKAVTFMNRYSNIVSMIALPLLSFIYFLFYIKGRYNYTEHLTAGMYMMGFSNLTYVLIFVPVSLMVDVKPGAATFFFISLFMLVQAAYCSLYYYNFIGRPGTKRVVKAVLVSLFVFFFWMSLSSVAIGFYIRNGFWGMVK